MRKKIQVSTISLIWLLTYLLMVGQQLWHHHHSDGSSCLSFCCKQQATDIHLNDYHFHHYWVYGCTHSKADTHAFPAHYFCCYMEPEACMDNSQQTDDKGTKYHIFIKIQQISALLSYHPPKQPYAVAKQVEIIPSFLFDTLLLRAPPLV